MAEFDEERLERILTDPHIQRWIDHSYDVVWASGVTTLAELNNEDFADVIGLALGFWPRMLKTVMQFGPPIRLMIALEVDPEFSARQTAGELTIAEWDASTEELDQYLSYVVAVAILEGLFRGHAFGA